MIDPNVPPKAEDGSQPPNAIYIGGNYIGRSLNKGTAFTRISPLDTTPADPTDPTDALPGPIPQSEIDIGLYTNLYGAVTTLAPAKSATPVPFAQVIYAGTDTGRVWKTADAGATWTRMQGLPERWVNKIIVDPDDINHVYAAFSGFRQGDDAANVYETKDGGASWQNVSHNMPNGPVEMIEYDPKGNVLFAGTDVGVFDLKDGDRYWYKISVGLPKAPVLDLKLSGDGKRLHRRDVRAQQLRAAAVHGRGRRRRRRWRRGRHGAGDPEPDRRHGGLPGLHARAWRRSTRPRRPRTCQHGG